MKVYIVSKATPSQLPPLMTVALYCREIGYDVVVITQNIGKEISIFESKGVEVHALSNPRLAIPFIGKLWHWYKFKCYMKNELSRAEDNSIIWITGADTLVLTDIKQLEAKRSIFQLNELNDESPFFRWLYKDKMSFFDKVVVPETNRSYISQVLYNLSKKPAVLPNKPYEYNYSALTPPEDIKLYIEQIEAEKKKGKVVFIYQGFISELRDLTQICIFVEKHKEKCSLVLMGADEGALKKYRSLCNDIIFVPFISAPWHLLVTSKCDVGIMIYLPISLNNIYCAPNKIWEYSKFGLAMVGNDIPGLLLLDSEKIGCTIDLGDERIIENNLSNLVNDINTYKENSERFYKGLDMKEEIKKILS